MIPKIIHYCWFGGNPLPPLAQKCIASWKKFLPGYEIKRWDESNFDINSCTYVQEAYQAKKWAFVSDYARFKILYDHGGLYFDTDVEIIRPLDSILSTSGVMGMEYTLDQQIGIAPGLGLAAKPGLELYKTILNGYHTRHFRNNDGSFDMTNVVTYTTKILKKYGLKNKACIQLVAGITIYPQEYFCPKNYATGKLHITSKTVAIHHYTASWLSNKSLLRLKLRHLINKYCPIVLKNKIFKIWEKLK